MTPRRPGGEESKGARRGRRPKGKAETETGGDETPSGSRADLCLHRTAPHRYRASRTYAHGSLLSTSSRLSLWPPAPPVIRAPRDGGRGPPGIFTAFLPSRLPRQAHTANPGWRPLRCTCTGHGRPGESVRAPPGRRTGWGCDATTCFVRARLARCTVVCRPSDRSLVQRLNTRAGLNHARLQRLNSITGLNHARF